MPEDERDIEELLKHDDLMTRTFVDADHIKAEWSFHERGEKRDVKTFNWKRARD